MRSSLVVLVALLGGLAGYALSPASAAEAQAPDTVIPFGFNESVTLLTADGRALIPCTVTIQRGNFIGCRADEQRPETLYNLQFVSEIRKSK
jgi:hypothetical protein